jgi:4-amino-4-deoxy-L-arabinose transferase-like glycosyltransferase
LWYADVGRETKKKIVVKMETRSLLAATMPFERSKRWRIVALTAILLLGGALRIVDIDRIPPAIHADEGPNAWNAWTLLNTGHDQDGRAWPVFYIRAHGDFRTAMYAYAILPFQFIGGMNVLTTRLPAATFGVLTILLLYFVGTRLLGITSGIIAAAFLSVNPWHIQISRWGHEASLSPFLTVASFAALFWANLPVCAQSNPCKSNPQILKAALAGVIIGASCYGYAPMRIFTTCLMAALLVVNWRSWYQTLTDRRGRLAVGAFLLSFAAVYIPVVWRHFTDPLLFERARTLGYVWQTSDSVAAKVAAVIGRYLDHYGPGFLFVRGDLDPALSPPNGFGLLPWYDLPLLSIGIVTLVKNVKTVYQYRILLIWLALYPVGDILFPHVSSHSLRSLPGVACFALISALGVVTAGNWLCHLKRQAARTSIAAIAASVILISSAAFLRSYFGDDFSRFKASHLVFGADILEASRWVAPRLSGADALFVTGFATQTDAIVLLGLNYDPRQWFRESRELIHGPLPDGRFKGEDFYVSYGKVHFLLTQEVMANLGALIEEDKPHRLLFIVRPGELGLERYAKPVHEVFGADGKVSLWIFDVTTLKGALVSG